jgi:PHS family inorganic phosphate transporter-like MFS transporter
MILFGYLADRIGRAKLYGVELMIVIAATLGLTQVSEGYNNASMEIYPWIIFWRTVLGVGIGAEYPLSAMIAAEYTSTEARGRMLAAVFLSQPLAQLTAYGTGLGSLRMLSHDRGLSSTEMNHDVAAPVIDSVWRLVVGVGCIPAFFAIIWRLSIPESPRYLLEVEKNAAAALESAAEVYPDAAKAVNRANAPSINVSASAQLSNSDDPNDNPNSSPVRGRTTGELSGNSGDENGPHKQETFLESVRGKWRRMKAVLVKNGTWRMLAGVSICWFLLDLGVYGLGLDNPRTLAKIWAANSTATVLESSSPTYDWQSLPGMTIYQSMESNLIHALYTTVPASITGCVLILIFVNHLPRVTIMVTIFALLGGVFIITGGSMFNVYETSQHTVSVVFYAISLFLLNLGPNTLTFMLPAELFETRYRGTCYGIAAASGKFGAVIIQIVLWAFKIGGPDKKRLAILLLVFAPMMLLGAFVAWVWIPEVQDPPGWRPLKDEHTWKDYLVFHNRSLERIAENPTEKQVIGMRENIKGLCRPRRHKSKIEQSNGAATTADSRALLEGEV